MNKRLAITISGAVSLGSYEAGVLFEIFRALAAHNCDPNTPADERIYVDVLTGASAGGMCATILAQKLLYDGAALAGESSNALHDPWVNDVSLEALLNQTPQEDTSSSLLSSAFIEGLSKKYITGRYQTNPPPAAVRHPAINPDKPLYLGLALSNLDGIDYARELRTGGEFIYTRYQDEFLRTLTTGADSDNAAAWEEARNAAVSCGAFPFAFAVKALQRKAADFADPVPAHFPDPGLKFAYTDGGVFQNEPLGMAKNFVDGIDEHQDTDTRFYLFVAPGTRGSSIAGGGTPVLTDKNADFLATGKALIGAIFNQARFHDWIMAEKANADVNLFNQRAAQLRDALLHGTATASGIASAAAAYLKLLQAHEPQRLTDDFIKDALKRLRQQFVQDYLALSAPTLAAGTADAWLNTILVLEIAADLETTDEMNIFAITANDDELAGSSVQAFAGFFDQRIRQHDYDVGRKKAMEFLDGQNAPGAVGLGPLRYKPDSPVVVNEAFNKFHAANLSLDERTKLRDRLLAGADALMTKAGMACLLRWPVKTFYLKPKLDAWLEMDAPEPPPGGIPHAGR